MNRLVSVSSTLAVTVVLFGASPSASAGDFWDFLQNAWEQIQAGYFQNDDDSAEALENEIVASAAQSGALVEDPDQYDEYAEKLAKTLSMLSPEQQARVFGN